MKGQMKNINIVRILIPTACIGVAMSIAVPADAQTKKVIIANDGHYTTRVLASNTSDTSAAWSLTEAGCFAYGPQTIVPGGAAIRDTVGQFCSPYPLADTTVATVKSIIHFSDGKSESSFVVPPVGAITVSTSVMLGPAINDDAIGSWLTFNASERSAVTVTIYDGSRNQIAVETADVPKGVSQFRPATKFAVGFIRVELGYKAFGITPSTAPLYGFLSVASPTNSNSIVYPF